MKPLWVYEVSNYDIASIIVIEFHCVTFKVQIGPSIVICELVQVNYELTKT
jgi:hypothetical protein